MAYVFRLMSLLIAVLCFFVQYSAFAEDEWIDPMCEDPSISNVQPVWSAEPKGEPSEGGEESHFDAATTSGEGTGFELPPECLECQDTTNKPTTDKCGLPGSPIVCAGGHCESGTCCCDFEWVAGTDGPERKCICGERDAFKIGKCDPDKRRTPVAGGGFIPSGNESCELCMCYAETENESSQECVNAANCAVKNRATGRKLSICDVVHQPTSKGGRQFTSAKCMCDREGTGIDPVGKLQYTQKYCECCLGSAPLPAAQRCAAAARVDCANSPYRDIDRFQEKSLSDPSGCKKITFRGSAQCRHEFFDCE